MKQYIIIIIGLVSCWLSWTSCTDEYYADKEKVEEGIPVDVKILFTSPEMQQVQTKADMGVTVENTVRDLQIFVFKSSGSLEKKFEFTSEEIFQTGGSANTGGIMLPNLTSGEKKVVAIANVTSSDIQCNLGNIRKFSELQKAVVNLKDKLLQRPGGLFVMSGYYGINVNESIQNEGDCSLDSKRTVNGVFTLDGKIWLRHLDSKIKFNVKVSGNNKEFVPKDWKVVNVPLKSYLFSNETDAAEEISTDFFTQEQESRFEETELNENRYVGGSFVFYMNENRKSALNWPSDNNDYNLREYKSDQGGGPDDPFKYADSRSTYVVVRGTFYEYDEAGRLLVSADVRYTIHLGYLSNVASDFNSERNKFYTYNVTVENVNKIILEVDSSQEGYDGGFKEEQPGSEGDVIMSDQNLLIDAHYDVKSIIFYKNKLDNLSVMVRTPYESANSTEGFYKIDRYSGMIVDNLKDFQWVEFARFKANQGYRSYKNAKESGDLKNIKQVLKELYDNKDSNDNFWEKDNHGNYLIAYTVFINEYYYEENPKKTNEVASWKDFVNAENRQMHILCDTKYSLDEQSSVTRSNIMINQRSIKSIYNVKSSELETAWGVETVEENGRYPSYLLKNNKVFTNTKTNGRYNMFNFFIQADSYSNEWKEYIDFTDNTFRPQVDKYKYAEYVCLHRNRDLNGNGKIDDDEIRWYLPATNQYIGLWIGQDALPAEARLLQTTVSNITSSNRFNYHLISSNGTRFWTEEGVSTGNTVTGNNNFHVRCARNLGKTNSKPVSEIDEPQDYVKVTRSGDYVASVDLSRVSSLALRTLPYTSIDFHTEHGGGDLNYPYKGGFNVDSETRKGTFSYDKSKGIGTLKGCPSGYRVPNQRELALIGGYSNNHFGKVGDTYKRLASCTYSALTYKSDIYLLGYLPKENINFLTLSGSSTSYVRCVKDN